MSEYQAARRGHGNTVHAFSSGGQLCGAGINTIGTRHVRGIHSTADPVTCKTCLKKLAQRGIDPVTLEAARVELDRLALELMKGVN